MIEAGDEGARVLVLAGEPFPDPITMWWNFVGRDHEDIVAARADWQAQVEQQRATGTRTAASVRIPRRGRRARGSRAADRAAEAPPASLTGPASRRGTPAGGVLALACVARTLLPCLPEVRRA